SVMVDGVAAESEYDGNTMSLCVDIPLLEASCPREIEIVYPDTEAYVPDGIIGQMRRVADAVNAVKNKKAGLLFREELAGLESAGRAISYKPEEYYEVIERFISNYEKLPEILMNHDLSDSERSELASQAGYGK
ncbi:MAG: alpha-xylosidase, partial [Muribaculaceae bacterium]|nr:alpha-xylosidase [Muribaculaceae bacterium]